MWKPILHCSKKSIAMDSPTAQVPSSPTRRPDLPPRRENCSITNSSSNSSSSSNSALLQHEIDMWSSLAAKTKTSKKQVQDEAHEFLTNNAMNKLRDLQKEISETDWMFDSSYD